MAGGWQAPSTAACGSRSAEAAPRQPPPAPAAESRSRRPQPPAAAQDTHLSPACGGHRAAGRQGMGTRPLPGSPGSCWLWRGLGCVAGWAGVTCALIIDQSYRVC